MGNILNSSSIQSILLEDGEELFKQENALAYDLADDNGYAYHKVAAWVKDSFGEKYIKTACIASRAQLGKVNVSVSGKGTAGLYKIDSEFYTVGDNVPDPESIRNNSYCYSEVNNVLVANAIYRSGFAELDFRLSTGLPLKQYFNNEGELNETTIEKVRNSLKPLAQSVSSENQPSIKEHLIYAESLAAFVDWLVDEKGNMVNKVTNGVLVVDVGGGTTDISFINSANEVYMPGSDTVKTGVLDVFKKLKQLLSSSYEIDEEHIRDDMLDKALRTNEFTVRGETKNCELLCDKAKQYVAKRLNTFIDELVTSTLDHIIFVGGGAEALRKQLLNLDEFADGFVVIPKEPQFANVRGMLKCMTYLDGQ